MESALFFDPIGPYMDRWDHITKIEKLNFIGHINFNESLMINDDFFKSFYTPFDLSSRAGKEYVIN